MNYSRVNRQMDYFANNRILISLLLLLMPIFYGTKAFCKTISLDNEKILVKGAAYVYRSPDKLFYKRFSDEALNAAQNIRMFSALKASSTSGTIIQFKTNSSMIHLTFSPEPGLNEKGIFKVVKDGIEFQTIPFDSIDDLKIEILSNKSSLPKKAVYEIILPSFSNPALTNFEIDDNSELFNMVQDTKKVYLSFGNSITHGRGQSGASYLTYPFILSEKLDLDLFNLGIGGAKVSVPIAEMSKDLPKADLITILIGYNDLNAGHSVAFFEENYRKYLFLIRKHQPEAKIFCISLLHTKLKESKNVDSDLTPDDFRNVIKKVVKEFQSSDKNLYLIEGEDITSCENLRPGTKTDPVHLTVKGAELFAHNLHREIERVFVSE